MTTDKLAEMRPEDVHPSHDVREEGILISDPVCQKCRASVHGASDRLREACPERPAPAVDFALCPECGALPCDWGSNPKRAGSAFDIISEAVDRYGKPGGPWNVPSDPGGWIARARDWLEQSEGAKS